MGRAWWFGGEIANLEGEGVIQGQALESAARHHGGLTADGGRKRGAWEGLPFLFGQPGPTAMRW